MKFSGLTLPDPSGRIVIIAWLAMLGPFTYVQAQTDFVTPYSLFGPGIVQPRHTVMQAGMGTAGMAHFDLYRLNILNPAVAANHAEPIFEFGTRANLSTYRTTEETVNASGLMVNNLSLSLPIKRNVWGLTFGLVPATSVGYEITTRNTNEELELDYITQYSGAGGLSQLYLGSSRKLIDKIDSSNNVTVLSFGGQVNFNLGNIESSRRLFFPGDPTLLGFRSRETVLVRGAGADFGIHYHTNIVKRRLGKPRMVKLLVGATYSPSLGHTAVLTGNTYNFRLSPNGVEFPRDTLARLERFKGRVVMPSAFGVGVGIDWITDKRARYRFAVDYRQKNWSEYAVDLPGSILAGTFENSSLLAVGAEYTPNVASQKLLERMEYRLGYRTMSTNLSIDNTAITEYGMSFGISLPIHFRKGLTNSTFNVSAEYGNQGTTENGLISEQFVRVYAGFTLTPHFRNRWFVRPKYD
jgi:hypothetical protein